VAVGDAASDRTREANTPGYALWIEWKLEIGLVEAPNPFSTIEVQSTRGSRYALYAMHRPSQVSYMSGDIQGMNGMACLAGTAISSHEQ
jgi:hypothetical protein